MSIATPSVEALHRAIQITEQVKKLETELQSLLGGLGKAAPEKPAKAAAMGPRGKKKRTMSPEARARIAAAQRARWAITKGTAASTSAEPSEKPAAKASRSAKKSKRNISPEARAKMVAAAKKRWANAKGTK